MIRAARLAVSRPMYAFKPASWRTAFNGHQVDAVWFKRKSGVLSAVLGTYHPMILDCDQEPTNPSYEAWILAADDNRYGGAWLAKWDGHGLSCFDQPVPPQVAGERTVFLSTMLAGFPNVPSGWDGWWTFPRSREGA